MKGVSVVLVIKKAQKVRYYRRVCCASHLEITPTNSVPDCDYYTVYSLPVGTKLDDDVVALTYDYGVCPQCQHHKLIPFSALKSEIALRMLMATGGAFATLLLLM